MSDHLLLKKETTFATPVTITTADVIPIRNATPATGENYIQDRVTGQGRALASNNRGSKIPALSGEGSLIPETFGKLINMLLGGQNTVQVDATAAYNHNFYPLDSAALPSATLQLIQIRNSASTVIGQKGAKMDSMEFSFNVDEVGTYSFEIMAQDEAKAGGTYEDASSSQAQLTPVYAVTPAPLMFTQVTVKYGVTATWNDTDKVFECSGGTTLAGVVNLTLTVNNNIDQGGVLGKRTADRMPEGQRDVELSLTISNDTPSTTFYDKMRAGTSEAIQILVVSPEEADTGEYYELEFVIPVATYEEAAYGDVSGEFGMRDVDLMLRGEIQQASGYDVGIRVKDTLTSDYA